MVPPLMPGADRLSCDEVLRRLDDYVDRALTEGDILRVEHHLADCLACAAATRFESMLIKGIRARLRRLAVPPGLRQAVAARLTAANAYRDDRHDLPSGGS
jgi:anti-sigma factor (TIGR02949 family)